MKRSLRDVLVATLTLGLILPMGAAIADYQIKDGNSALQTVLAFVCQTSKICPAQVLIDSSGNEKATASNPLRVDPVGTTAQPVASIPTNPNSTLTLPSTTTAYSAGQLIANSATAGSVTVPSFSFTGSIIPRLRLSINDTTSTAWGGVGIQVDLWSAPPTVANGDRGAFSPATGTANHLGSFTCTMSPEYGDGAFAECAPSIGSAVIPKLASGSSIYWTLQTTSASGVTGASKTFTLTAEVLN